MPDADHPDPGTGWTDKSGKTFYFVGTYNSFVSEQLLLAVNDLSHAFALTGDDRYGHKAALLLDHLARVYPTCTKGSWDYPSNPPSGRFNRPWYQVARTLIQYADDYDILMNSNHLNEPSSVPGLTRRQNIEKNLILNGGRYCFEQSVLHPSLTNGQCDYIRGTLVAGVALGIPEYLKWGVDGPTSIRAMIENNIDRDGQYYETSTGYSHHSRYLYLNTAELLNHYTDANYPAGIHLADHPKLRAFAIFPQSRTQVAGLQPHLGDDTPNTKPGTSPTPAPEDLTYLDQLYALSTSPNDRDEIARLLLASTHDLNATRTKSPDPVWLLFHADDLEEKDEGRRMKDEQNTPTHPRGTGDPPVSSLLHPSSFLLHPLTNSPLDSSDLLTQRNFALLRSPASGVALTLRSGPTLNHGHLDELNLNLFAFHQDLTYDLGYGLASTHTQVGWAKQTASHNTVLVDETPQLQSPSSGGFTRQFLALPGLTLTTVSDPNAYTSEKVTTYDRTVALIDAGPADAAYAVDIFRVAGGHHHDYVFHARGTDVSTDTPMSDPAPGSLASPDINYPDHTGPDGDILDHPNHPYWNPPPGNGLGFLSHPRTANPTAPVASGGESARPRAASVTPPFSLTWTFDPQTHLRATCLPTPNTTYVIATAPGILPGKYPQATYLYARRDAASSTFVTTLDPHRGTPTITSVQNLLPPPTDADSDVAIKLSLSTGRTDYLFQRPSVPTRNAVLPTTVIRDGLTEIRLPFVGTALVSVMPDRSTAITLAGCTDFEFAGTKVLVHDNLQSAPITDIDYQHNVLYTTADVPQGDLLANQFLNVTGGYSRPTTYRISHVTRDGDRTAIHLAPTTMLLARAHMDAPTPDAHTLPNVIPLEYAKSITHHYTGFFNGKRVTTPDGRASATISAVNGATGTTVTVDAASAFPADTDLLIYDVKPGDRFTIPTYARITLSKDHILTTQSPVPLTLTRRNNTLTTTPSSSPQPAD